MFIKTVISSGLLILAVGFSFPYASAASIDHHHEGNSHELTLSKLNVKSSSKPQHGSATTRSSEKKNFVKITQSYELVIQHYCPVNGKIMEGPICEMGLAPSSDTESSDTQKEYFIASECGGHHNDGEMVLSQINHKAAEAVMFDNKLTVPSFLFSYLQSIDYSQEYFNSPYKPPKFFS